MGLTTTVNGRTVVHKRSGGMTGTFPDICQTPTPAGPVPIPYLNVARSADGARGSARVTVDGNPIMLEGSCFARSSGAEAGSAGGLISATTGGRAEFVSYALDVRVEGRPVCRQFDLMVSNMSGAANTPPGAECQPSLVLDAGDELRADDWHALLLRLGYEHPDVVGGMRQIARLRGRHALNGAAREGGGASGAVHEAPVQAGDYRFELLDAVHADGNLAGPP